MRVKRKTKKPLIIAISIIIVVIIIAALLWFYAFADTRDNDKPESSTSEQTTKDEKQNKDEQAASKNSGENQNNQQSVPHEKEKELPQLYEGGNTNNSSDLTGAITAKSVTGDNLVIRNTINQLISSGSCTLSLTSGSKTVTKTAEIIQNPSSSACAGFDVPVAELGRGSWNIEIKVSSGDRGLTLKETVNI